MSEQNPWDFSEYSDPAGPAGPSQRPAPGGMFPDAGGPQAPQSGGFGAVGGEPDPGGPFGASSAPTVTTQPPTMFGASAEPPRQLMTARPPVHWLAVAAGLAVVGIVIALTLGGLPPVAIAAWVLAGPVGIGALAFFTTSDLKARSGGVYLAQSWVKPLYWVSLALCLIGAMVAAWKIAEWVGRL